MRVSPVVRPHRALGVTMALALAASPAALLSASGSAQGAEPDTPGLRLYSVTARSEVHRPAGEPAYVALPFFATPTGGTFDLKVSRPDLASPITVRQVVHGESATTEVALPDVQVNGWRGLPRFLRVTVKDADGVLVSRQNRRFCPNGWGQQRIDPDSTDRSVFPEGCYGMPFGYGSRWGISDGWAAPLEQGVAITAPRGRYTVTASVNARYREIWDIAPEDASASTVVRLRNGPYDDEWHERRTRPRSSVTPTRTAPRSAVKVVADAPTDNLPDLRTLPAFGMRTSHAERRDWLNFGANIWVGGTSLLDIEGFRRPGEDVMDAYQYFYEGDRVVGRARVGEMEYDTRDGHFHWHLLQFAGYQLLDADQQHVTTGRKQSFCIVPTDPVDLSLDGAELRPYQTGLDSACGGRDTQWIRETLPVGWGDTYYQEKGGQAFNITRVPNGTYYVAVEANPTRELFESDTANNVSLRRVVLGGKPGRRTVCVPALHGIDAHGTCR